MKPVVVLLKPNIWWISAQFGSFFGIETFTKKKKPPKASETTSDHRWFQVDSTWNLRETILVSRKKTFFRNPPVHRFFVSRNLASFQNLESKYFWKFLKKMCYPEKMLNNCRNIELGAEYHEIFLPVFGLFSRNYC